MGRVAMDNGEALRRHLKANGVEDRAVFRQDNRRFAGSGR
jgi:hypothetical protein